MVIPKKKIFGESDFKKYSDNIDLTIECDKYRASRNPLGETLTRERKTKEGYLPNGSKTYREVSVS
jgi:hypothetical protein